MAKQRNNDKGFSVRPLYVILFFLLVFFVLGGVYLSQRTKLRSIDAEKAILQKELDSLTVEQERLERMLEYVRTNDYLLQYAREKLGYMYPSDYKFYSESASNSVSGGTAISASTPIPLETPLPFDVPSDEDAETDFVPLPIGNTTNP